MNLTRSLESAHSCPWPLRRLAPWIAQFLITAACLAAPATMESEVKNLSFSGGYDGERARLVIEAILNGIADDQNQGIYTTLAQHEVQADADRLLHTFDLRFQVVHGELEEVVLSLNGKGRVTGVQAETLKDWSERLDPQGRRFLVLRPDKALESGSSWTVRLTAETELSDLPCSISALTVAPEQPTLFSGTVKLESTAGYQIQLADNGTLTPIEPDKAAPANQSNSPSTVRSYLFYGLAYSLPLRIMPSDPEAGRAVLHDFLLSGRLEEETAVFALTGVIEVKTTEGASLSLLAGEVGLTSVNDHPDWELEIAQGHYTAHFDKPGRYPLSLEFHAAVGNSNEWRSIRFQVAPSSLQPVVLSGLPADTQFQFIDGAEPERVGADYHSFLPPNGSLKLAWKAAVLESEGRLFYATETLAQISVGPGLMRQTTLMEYKVMQGELDQVRIEMIGAGEVTRVQGPQVLSWSITPDPDPDVTARWLTVRFNQPQTVSVALAIQTQTPLPSFPHAFDVLRLNPENAIRSGGFFRVVNDGAVRLEVVDARALSQISPDKFPHTQATQSLFPAAATQQFAYRFAGGDFSLRIQADTIQPELTVSELLVYHLGETERSIELETELDIREAPLRELRIRIPAEYSVAQLKASGLSDYFVGATEDVDRKELRLVYAQPLTGRQVLRLRLERSQASTNATWRLPEVTIPHAKAVRGHIAISADAGFRLTPTTTEGLTDLATAFFPKQIAGIQNAFRLNEPDWRVTVDVKRLAQSIQADVLHLFSIGEGIAYGSTVVYYLVNGAPISTFHLDLSEEYYNVEFSGKDIRNWQKTDTGYLVQLHTPVSGAYTLLTTYERPFDPQGATLAFTGARPNDAQLEQGHIVVISTYQFQVTPEAVSSGVLPLEPGEVPGEYRLFFDAPILSAYRYSTRPFDLQLGLTPLEGEPTVSQVVDRAALKTRISEEGQVLTDARYYVKNKGMPYFRVTLPETTSLWSVTVDERPVVPVNSANANMIPLPQQADPDTVHTIDLKLADRSARPDRVEVATPKIGAPVLLAEWTLEPAEGRRLAFRRGSIAPSEMIPNPTGFGLLRRLFSGRSAVAAIGSVLASLLLILLARLLWHLSSKAETHRFSLRHLTGAFMGLIACGMALVILGNLAVSASTYQGSQPASLHFVAPVQQSDDRLVVEVENLPMQRSSWATGTRAWPMLLGVAVWVLAAVKGPKRPANLYLVSGWTLVFWGALRSNGLMILALVGTLFLIVHWFLPSLWKLWRLPVKATAALLLLSGLGFTPDLASAATGPKRNTGDAEWLGIADSVVQQIKVTENQAQAEAVILWRARKGQRLPLLSAPGVLTRIDSPQEATRVYRDGPGYALLATQAGTHRITLHYEVSTEAKVPVTGIHLPTQYGLINEVTLTIQDREVDVNSPEAISTVRTSDNASKSTTAQMVLRPTNRSWIAWQPRQRDTRLEKSVFYADLVQIYVPSAGVVEGLHQVEIRPAHGQVNELTFAVPESLTITDVMDSLAQAPTVDPETGQVVVRAIVPPVSRVSLWRFDPDANRLRVTLSAAQATPFSLLIRSQVATRPLPYTQAVGLLSVVGAAEQIGLLGIATGAEVHLESTEVTDLSTINIEDFPGLPPSLAADFPGLTLRRAFRYASPEGTASLAAAAVEPDVRVVGQETVSLGEDRIVLAADLSVTSTRAGIFKLRFPLPEGLEVESISGDVLSHWTELKTDDRRLVTLHLRGKTEGEVSFSVSLSGPGLRTAQDWAVPRLRVEDAGKQQSQLLVVPEQGMRLQVNHREGATQVDPAKAGIRQKGVLAFRMLHDQAQLTLDIEQVDPWIQVSSLQSITLSDARIKVVANLQYQIENTGVNMLQIQLPADADSVSFTGKQVSDFLIVEDPAPEGSTLWEVRMHRRVIGEQALQVSYQLPLNDQISQIDLKPVQAAQVNLQRGYVTLSTEGRLQANVQTIPPELQLTEWQAIPKVLQADLPLMSADYTFRLVRPNFSLPVGLQRHEATRLLPAQVTQVQMTSVISDDAIMLTQAHLSIIPGDKRLLELTLPQGAHFWFAFVNQNSVWPWRSEDRILIPLEQQSRVSDVTQVEFFYSNPSGTTRSHKLDLELLAPKFDLPLENITWRVFLSDKWELKDWDGSLQMVESRVPASAEQVDLDSYIANEVSLQRQKTKEAEQLITFGNDMLSKGDPQQARRAFQAAYGLSRHDDAFNEDARVQLHNLKMQQALVGLNARQASLAGEAVSPAANLKNLQSRGAPNYTQQEAKQILDNNSVEDNAVQIRLAERLIQQQDAAVTRPGAIRAAIPEQGRVLTFTRGLEINRWADLSIRLETEMSPSLSFSAKAVTLLVTVLAITLLLVLGRPRSTQD